jgi:hypothetical protein
MTQSLIDATAAACREFAETDGYEEDLQFLQAWHKQREVYEAMVTACPRCDTNDPGDPPPPL